MPGLAEQQCRPDVRRLNDIERQQYRAMIDAAWSVAPDRRTISREFRLAGYDQTIALANAVADIAKQQDHHPDICFGYNRLSVSYSTHSVDGLSLNDFICAARIDLIDIS